MKLTVKHQDELFTLPNDNWMFINHWIGELITTGKLEYGERPNDFPPAFVDAVNLSEEWTTTTFNQIERLAECIVTYTRQAINNWQFINEQVERLPRGSRVPSSLQMAIENELANLKDATDQICRQITSIAKAVNTLQSSFAQTAAQWKKNQREYEGFCDFIAFADYLPIPPGTSDSRMCSTILAISMTFVHLLEALERAWYGLKKDLSGISRHPTNIDLPFVLSLDINNAINDWRTIRHRAEAFPLVKKEALAFWHIPDNKTSCNIAVSAS